MEKKGYSSRSWFGSVNHYDSHGKKVGHSSPGMFGRQFWEYVKEAGYEHLNKSTGNAQFYRFTSPKSKEYPYMIEIFSRNPDFIILEDDATVHRHIFLFYVNYKRGGRLYLFRPLCLSLKESPCIIH